MADGESITKQTYEDPEIVEAYIQRNTRVLKQKQYIQEFSKLIQGKRVLDLGCGPGHDAYIFADLGFEVTGIDYSREMIKRAQTLKKSINKPNFVVGDMRRLSKNFKPEMFDAVWAMGSLLHIRPIGLDQVLAGIQCITTKEAFIFIGLKDGDSTVLVDEDKLGKPMQREFTLWHREEFLSRVDKFGWRLIDYVQVDGSQFRGTATLWHKFTFARMKSA